MTRIVPLSISLLASLCALVLYAQDKPAAKKKTESAAAGALPRPAPEMKELRELIGTWSYEAAWEPSPGVSNSGTGTGTYAARLGPGEAMPERSGGTDALKGVLFLRLPMQPAGLQRPQLQP
jgi:hypothetical protein